VHSCTIILLGPNRFDNSGHNVYTDRVLRMALILPRKRAAGFQEFLENERDIGTTGASMNREKAFVTTGQLRDYWTPLLIREALGDLQYSNRHIDHIRKNYICVFSILVVITRVQYITELIQDERFADHRLPFDSNNPYTPQGWPFDKEDFQSFCAKQWQFCVPVLDGEQLMSGLRFHEDRILPYRKLKDLESGDTATTCKIEVRDSCNRIVSLVYTCSHDTHICSDKLAGRVQPKSSISLRTQGLPSWGCTD
jgi:hypothetical protein